MQWSWLTSSSCSMLLMDSGMRYIKKTWSRLSFWELQTRVLCLLVSCLAGGHPDHYGYDAWRFWLHVGLWWFGVGSFYLFAAGLLPGQPSQPSELHVPCTHHHTQTSVFHVLSIFSPITRPHKISWWHIFYLFQWLVSTSSGKPTMRRMPLGETHQTPDCPVSSSDVSEESLLFTFSANDEVMCTSQSLWAWAVQQSNGRSVKCTCGTWAWQYAICSIGQW